MEKFAKVMFLQLSVSHSVHRGVSASVHAGIHTHPGSRHPSGADTPWSRHPRADTPWEQTPPGADPPEQTPPGSRHSLPTCTVHAERYGQQVGGTHPTGMHTCFRNILEIINLKKSLNITWILTITKKIIVNITDFPAQFKM